MSEELKPCPFCGGQVKLKADDSGGYSIECDNHEWPKERFTQQIPDKTIAADVLMCSWGQGEDAKQALIEAWNTRAEPMKEIIHCEDCENAHFFYPWRYPGERSTVEVGTCALMAEGVTIERDGYCAFAERQEQ